MGLNTRGKREIEEVTKKFLRGLLEVTAKLYGVFIITRSTRFLTEGAWRGRCDLIWIYLHVAKLIIET